jgi:hypothetical protein
VGFLTPLYLAGAALIAIPIVLHLLRRDVAPPVPFTAVHLLQKTSVDRSRRHRLRDLLLLAARVCALLLLAASFARPYRAGAPATTRTTVIAVDRSFSMAAPGRAERARTLAREAIDQARGDRIAVVAFDERADVVAASGLAADARAAIAAIQPGYGATRYAAAFDKAAELLADSDRARLVIVSDLQRSGFDASTAVLPEGIDLVVRDAGSAVSNLSVTSVAFDATRHAITATVRNDGADARTTDVTVTAGERVLPARQVSIVPGGAADISFDAVGEPRTMQVAVADATGYAADNARFAIVERRGLPRILIVTGGPGSTAGFYLSHALQADAGEGPDFDVRSLGSNAFSAMTPEQMRDVSSIVLLSTHGLDRRVGETLRTFLANGGGLFVAASADVDPSVLSALLQWQPVLTARDSRRVRVLAATDLRHPVFRPFDAVAANFGQVAFERAWEIDGGSAWRVAARFTDGIPALLERRADALTGAAPGHVLLFASDLDRRWNDFPLHPTFVPFAQEVARYLGSRPPAIASFVVADAPSGVPAVPGFARIADRTVAVNVDPRESRVDRVTPADFEKMVTRTAAGLQPRAQRFARETESHQNYWRYGLMLLLATLVVEAFVGSR